MKLSKTLLQTIALAVTVAAVSASCTKDDSVKPKEEKTEAQKVPSDCPACGMG